MLARSTTMFKEVLIATLVMNPAPKCTGATYQAVTTTIGIWFREPSLMGVERSIERLSA